MSGEAEGITQDLASALIRGEVWERFVALPQPLRREFIEWLDAAEGDDNRARRLRTLVALLRKQAGLPGIKDRSTDDATE